MIAWMLAVTLASPVTVAVEVAATPAELRRGLQGHAPLAAGQGMIFHLTDEEVARFWMKDVTYPIDIIFIDRAGKIDSIAAEAPPCLDDGCPVYRSQGEVTHVLEVPAGWSAKHGLQRGDRIDIDGRTVRHPSRKER